MPFLPLKRYPLSCLYVHDLFVGVWQGGMLLVFVFFVSCCQTVIGYVDCWRPACFCFSLLFDAGSKFWLVHS